MTAVIKRAGNQAAADYYVRPQGHWNGQLNTCTTEIKKFKGKLQLQLKISAPNFKVKNRLMSYWIPLNT
jgi:hypothetical protein